MVKAKWMKGNKEVEGWWEYCRSSDTFNIRLNKRCAYSGEYITFIIYGEVPDFNGWKRTDTGNHESCRRSW